MLRKNIRTPEVDYVESVSSSEFFFLFIYIARDLYITFTFTLCIQYRAKHLSMWLAASV